MEQSENIEIQLWEYIDGTLNNACDCQRIAHLIEHDSLWHRKYQELSAFQASLSAHMDSDMPSMSFSRNVMEAIAQDKIAKPAQKYINPVIIKGIAAMFILELTAFIVYACIKIDWSLSNTSTDVITNFFKNFSLESYNGTFINIFLSINVMLVLLLGDKLLHKRRYIQNSL